MIGGVARNELAVESVVGCRLKVRNAGYEIDGCLSDKPKRVKRRRWWVSRLAREGGKQPV